MSEPILVELIDFAGVLIGALVVGVGLWRQLKKERERADAERKRAEEEKAKAEKAEAHSESLQRELYAQAYFHSFGYYLHDFQSVAHQAMTIIHDESNPIDRILIFQAWNGEHEPRRTTSVLQFRAEGQQMTSYREVEPDLDYKARVRHIKVVGPLRFTVSEIPPCMIKGVYEREGVKSSLWMHISTLLVPGTNAAAISYASYSSHNAKAIDDETLTVCRLLNDRFVNLAETYEKGAINMPALTLSEDTEGAPE